MLVLVYSYEPDDFKHHFRVEKSTFEIIQQHLSRLADFNEDTYNRGRPRVCLQEQLLISLWLLSTPECFRSVSDRFDVSRSTAHSIFVRVISALQKHISKHIIRWPSGVNAVRATVNGFHRMKGMDGVIGAIDGSHIPIKAPSFCPENYFNRKSFHSIILQAVCNHDMIFTDCFAGWPGSVHDSRVLHRSDLFAKISANREAIVPDDTYIVGMLHILWSRGYLLPSGIMVI